jgi:dGTPase
MAQRKMRWSQLLSARRIRSDGSVAPPLLDEPPLRTDFQRDADRILFSPAFRRLKDKTQIFPMPENDLIHSRLTHSNEVAVIGRSLGFAVGREIAARHGEDPARSWAQDCADVVCAACLSHDIGNPPFGHSGEDAIGRYFRSDGAQALLLAAGLTERQRLDLVRFEGNAQGFRILTRLHDEPRLGMRLTAATLAAFSKYPRESGDDLTDPAVVFLRKPGFFQAERASFSAVAEEVGLLRLPGPALSYCRHPLAYLVEAADDIAYCILDLEDGLRLNLVPRQKGLDALRAVAEQTPHFDLPEDDESNDVVEYLRARAIKQLLIETQQTFMDCEESILQGTYYQGLLDAVPSAKLLQQIRGLSETYCYNSRSVLEIELAGYRLLGELLGELVPAALKVSSARCLHEQKLLRLLPRVPNEADPYERVLRVTDYISGMTDSFAVSLYRKLRGISLPGSVRF